MSRLMLVPLSLASAALAYAGLSGTLSPESWAVGVFALAGVYVLPQLIKERASR